MNGKKKIQEADGNKLIFQAVVVLTTMLAMLSGIFLYDKWNHEIIPSVVIGTVLSIIYVIAIQKGFKRHGWGLLFFHILELVLCVAGFFVPGLYRPVGAFCLAIALLTNSGGGMSAAIFYSMLSLLYDIESVETVAAYLICGMIGSALSPYIKNIVSFFFCNLLTAIGYGVSYVMIAWLSYMVYTSEELKTAGIGSCVLFVASTIGYIIVKILYKGIGQTHDDEGVSDYKTEKEKKQIKGRQVDYTIYIKDDYKAIAEFKKRNLVSYKHSKLVAEMSGQAAAAIGCDEALTRAGAMYHEIGEGIGSDYVEESLKIAKKYRIPKAIEAIIREHNAEKTKPSSKEAAIVMLSDTIISTMEHGRKKSGSEIDAKKVIDRAFEVRENSGILKQSGLDKNEIHILKEVYENMLG